MCFIALDFSCQGQLLWSLISVSKRIQKLWKGGFNPIRTFIIITTSKTPLKTRCQHERYGSPIREMKRDSAQTEARKTFRRARYAKTATASTIKIRYGVDASICCCLRQAGSAGVSHICLSLVVFSSALKGSPCFGIQGCTAEIIWVFHSFHSRPSVLSTFPQSGKRRE